jgi:hypothetical protein
MERLPMPHRQDRSQDRPQDDRQNDRQNDRQESDRTISRRIFLQQMRWAPVLFLPATVTSPLLLSEQPRFTAAQTSHFPFADIHFAPHYPTNSPLDAVLRLAAPGTDEYVTERYASELTALLEEWSQRLKLEPPATATLGKFVDSAIQSIALAAIRETRLRPGDRIEVLRREFCLRIAPRP